MNYLKNKEPKVLIYYILKRLKGKGYFIFVSPRSPKRTYYLKSISSKTIRISDHELHEKQIKKSQIDVVVFSDFSVAINKEKLEPHEIHSYKSIIAEKILALLK